MIVLFTDFGTAGPYVGQMKMVLQRHSPGVPVIDLFSDAPPHDPRAAAYLLAACAPEIPEGSVVLGVVDPGVGGERAPIVLEADGRWFVGPDNGLFEIVRRRASRVRAWRITWRPERLSASFHGRDLFAPVAARIAREGAVPGEEIDPAAIRRDAFPDDLAEIVHIDHFGNAVTGLRTAAVPKSAVIVVNDTTVGRARTFSDVPLGAAFWYENSNGLVEIAVNCGRSDRDLGLRQGTPVVVVTGGQGES